MNTFLNLQLLTDKESRDWNIRFINRLTIGERIELRGATEQCGMYSRNRTATFEVKKRASRQYNNDYTKQV